MSYGTKHNEGPLDWHGTGKFGHFCWMDAHIGDLASICIVVVAALGYVRLLLKRRKRRARRDQMERAQDQEQSDRMIDRLRDTFLWTKKSGKDSN